ncbi:polyisoprenoid-binding protein [Paenibacillus rhizovicinus]|uniref:Polyisoprenoid-binding protein n=1 Tax=Paenibacillus rhizovicinus TaxID=2704463 RepID=A0A6C0P1W5_9BACL|nr:YceI family protein [Paenibacillus rhizovicinus]QHW32459.1 polyisoprenoid-binding protein [Paenibacillus rhizovicinus]
MSTSKWLVDATHSSVDFTIKHMMIAKVKGTFHEFSAEIEADPTDLTTANIQFNIVLASIDTRNADRDNHLRTGDFFDIEKYPTLTFQSTSISKTGDGEYDVVGNLNLHGLTRSETFHVSYEGTGKDPWGNEKVGFSGKGSFRRSDFGLTYNAVLETGGVLIGDEVKFTIEIEAGKAN